MLLWHQQYLACCAELNQWDTVVEYAKVTDNCPLQIDSMVQLHDWQNLKAVSAACCLAAGCLAAGVLACLLLLVGSIAAFASSILAAACGLPVLPAGPTDLPVPAWGLLNRLGG